MSSWATGLGDDPLLVIEPVRMCRHHGIAPWRLREKSGVAQGDPG